MIIDCPPCLGSATVTALVAADGVMIPCQTHYLSYRELYKLKSTITKGMSRLNPQVPDHRDHPDPL
jgi:chromosome partitioning protein